MKGQYGQIVRFPCFYVQSLHVIFTRLLCMLFISFSFCGVHWSSSSRCASARGSEDPHGEMWTLLRGARQADNSSVAQCHRNMHTSANKIKHAVFSPENITVDVVYSYSFFCMICAKNQYNICCIYYITSHYNNNTYMLKVMLVFYISILPSVLWEVEKKLPV